MAKAASLFFGGRTGMRSCGVSVTDITNGGAGIYTQGLAVLPMTFELAFDNFRRKCRLIWRDGNFFGVAFENQNTRTDDETKVSEADGVIPAFPALSDSPQLACLGEADGWSGWPGYSRKVMAGKSQHQADLRFTIGVAVALALPVLIGLGAYIATTTILRAG
ncbi:MAG: hypothetical protein ACXWKP_02425 [Bradyrhizobium sp.]